MNNRTDSFKVGTCVSIAWEKVSGSKGTFMACFGLIFAIAIVAGIISGVVMSISPFVGELLNFAVQLFLGLLACGVMLIGIRRARGLPITYKQMFDVVDLNIAVNLLIAYVLVFIVCGGPIVILIAIAMLLMAIGNMAATALGVIFFIATFIATFYLIFRTLLTYAFVLDRGMNGLDALKSSFECTKGHTLQIGGIAVIQILAYLVGMLLLLIGLIWAIPFYLISYGLLYVQLSDMKYPVPAVINQPNSK